MRRLRNILHWFVCGWKSHLIYYRDVCFKDKKGNNKKRWVVLHEFLKICDVCGKEVGQAYQEAIENHER
jgi:hypothetical protein